MNKRVVKYIHDEAVHNFYAAREVVPFIIDLLSPNSVADVGCGTGTWLKVFEDHKITDFIGIDGAYVNKSKLKIDESSFVEHDLELFYTCSRKYDLVISLEVAEHLKEESAEIFINTLTCLGDNIIFSAAIPNQGGQNHLNEQEPEYWIKKFQKEGFECFDILRPVFWENKKVDCWYKQNMFLFTKNNELKELLRFKNSFLNAHLVHPELLSIKEINSNNLNFEKDQILNSKKAIKFYFDLLFHALNFKIKRKLIKK